MVFSVSNHYLCFIIFTVDEQVIPTMNKDYLKHIWLVCSILLLAGCFGPKTPQEVAHAFWDSVIHNDIPDVVNFSTLNDAQQYDSFSKDWSGYQPSWGKVVIDGDQASIVSEFTRPDEPGSGNRKFVTYLVRHDKQWKVDYERTKMAVHGGALGALFGKLSQLGDDLSQQLASSTDSFNREMERMASELEQLSESYGQQAMVTMEVYAEQLRQYIEALEESINRALEEEDDNLSDKDRHALRAIAADLEQDSQNLAAPTTEAITEGSKNIGKAQQQLVSIDGAALNKYRQEWLDMAAKFEADMRNMLDELSKTAPGDRVQ